MKRRRKDNSRSTDGFLVVGSGGATASKEEQERVARGCISDEALEAALEGCARGALVERELHAVVWEAEGGCEQRAHSDGVNDTAPQCTRVVLVDPHNKRLFAHRDSGWWW